MKSKTSLYRFEDDNGKITAIFDMYEIFSIDFDGDFAYVRMKSGFRMDMRRAQAERLINAWSKLKELP